MMAKTPSLNASIRVVGILPTLKSLCIRRKVLLPDSTANNIIALGFHSAGSRVRWAPRVHFSIAGSTASMVERRRERPRQNDGRGHKSEE
jgi:hypothetical protein